MIERSCLNSWPQIKEFLIGKCSLVVHLLPPFCSIYGFCVVYNGPATHGRWSVHGFAESGLRSGVCLILRLVPGHVGWWIVYWVGGFSELVSLLGDRQSVYWRCLKIWVVGRVLWASATRRMCGGVTFDGAESQRSGVECQTRGGLLCSEVDNVQCKTAVQHLELWDVSELKM